MWQRIQTIYLVLALIATVVCLSLPVGYFIPEGMGGETTMYNLWKVLPEGQFDFSIWPMYVLLLLTCPLCLVAIFAFQRRMLQSRLCVFCILLDIAWIVAYAVFGYVAIDEGVSFKPAFAACLPIVCIVLFLLARRGILNDERLVRSTDRLR